MTESSLVPIEKINFHALFTGDGKLDALLGEIEKRALDFAPDVSTLRGRKEIASMAHKVARSKTLLDGEGKKLGEDWRAKVKKVDAERRKVRDFCDDLKSRVRKPLDEWEDAEEKRVDRLRAKVNIIRCYGHLESVDGTPFSSEELSEHLEALKAFKINESFQEFQEEAERLKAETIAAIKAHIARQEKYEAEQAELERLRRAEEERKVKEEADRIERERKEREERIAREAAERAKREAAEKAAKEKADAERRERALKEAAERAEREKIEAAARARAEKEAAVRAAEERARREAEEAERKRKEKEAAELAAAERKAANKRHRAMIDREAAAALVSNGYTAEEANNIVALIASGAIDHIAVNY